MLKKIDKGIFFLFVGIVIFGFWIFFSASLVYLKNPDYFFINFVKQLGAIILGFSVGFILLKTKFITATFLKKYAFYFVFMAFLIQLLVFVPGWGMEVNGAKRWVNLGFISFQPSEIFKFAYILFLSTFVYNFSRELKKFSFFLKVSPLIFSPLLVFIIIKDLGTLISLALSVLIIFSFSKINKKMFWSLVISGLLVFIPLIYFTVPYAQERIDSYKNLILYDKKSYHIQRNFISIGSGEIIGRGFGSSMQKYSKLLPEADTDSIFPIYAEEQGFLGSVFFVLLFFAFTFLLFRRAGKLRNIFEKILISSWSFLLVFPVFFNIGVSVGLMPFSGMPLTFVSRGGTALFISIIITFLILKISKKY